MTEQFRQLKELLEKLFQLDKPDLDFGIYRIMHARAHEISRFLETQLLPQVHDALAAYDSGNRTQLEADLNEARAKASELGVDPEQTPRVAELRAQLTDAPKGDAVEGEVYDLIYCFFSRYYCEGDFISKRRYTSKSPYVIPYSGEEVTLHWANKDQYYIKTSEYLRDYAFRLNLDDNANPMHVHFKLVDATEGEHGNVKAVGGAGRVFVLADGGTTGHDFLAVEKGELTVRFEYRPATVSDWPADQREGQSKPPKQENLVSIAEAAVLKCDDPELEPWISPLKVPRSGSAKSTVASHLDRYVARNTFDYFIHKDLGTFLRRELDFFIKNEVMRLDDIEDESAAKVEQYLSKIKAVRKVAGKVIDFLAQLEDFQKKLWLKKKFVVGTSYLITVGNIEERFYDEICANDAQREEWVELFAIDEIEGDLVTAGYSVPLTSKFLVDHPNLVVDSRHLTSETTERIVESFDDGFFHRMGLLVHAENADALRLLGPSVAAEPSACVYIDPPYNTGDDGFLYKDNYQHSSWCSLLNERLQLARGFLSTEGAIAISIDEEERSTLTAICDSVFGRSNRLPSITVKRASVTGHKVINPGVVAVSESVLHYAIDRPKWRGRYAFTQRDRDHRYSSVVLNRDDPEDQWRFESLLDSISSSLGLAKTGLRKELGDRYEEVVTSFVLERAESVFRLARVDRAGVGVEFVAAVDRSRLEPDRVIRYPRPGYPDVYLRNGERMISYIDKVADVGGSRATVERASDIWTDVLPNDLHNEGGVELPKGKKPEALIARILEMNSEPGDLVLDFFAGSGTTAAVAQKAGRRWIAVEGSTYFDSKAVRRVKNTLWGEPRGVSRTYGWTGGGAAKIVRLESYEDTLNNLELPPDEPQLSLLKRLGAAALREDYILRYMLDVESRGSQSLLNIGAFTDPTAYQLSVKSPASDESRHVNADLLETFNYLIGLTVARITAPRTFSVTFGRDDEKRLQVADFRQSAEGPYWFRTVTGTSPDGQRVLVIWRKRPGGEDSEGVEQDNAVLDHWFANRHQYSTSDSTFDIIYVNGGNNLENMKQPDETWRVRLIEEDFHRLMFDSDGMP